MRAVAIGLGLICVLLIAVALVRSLQPDPPRVSGDECATVDTDAPISPTSEYCWNRFAAVGVFVCPTQAHPDWLTALPPHCPP